MEHEKYINNVYRGFDDLGYEFCLVAKSAGILSENDQPYMVFIDPQLTTTDPMYKREGVVTSGMTHAIIDPGGNHITIDLRNPIFIAKKRGQHGKI